MAERFISFDFPRIHISCLRTGCGNKLLSWPKTNCVVDVLLAGTALFIKELKPSLNKQSDSIRANLSYFYISVFYYFKTYILVLVFTYFIVRLYHAPICN